MSISLIGLRAQDRQAGRNIDRPVRKCGRKQHIGSQMAALADVFDALRTERPY
jgi:hypothetical protein